LAKPQNILTVIDGAQAVGKITSTSEPSVAMHTPHPVISG